MVRIDGREGTVVFLQGRFRMIVHVFGGTAGDEPEGWIATICGHDAVPVGAEQSPLAGIAGSKPTILDQLRPTIILIHHTDVIEQAFSIGDHSGDKLVVSGRIGSTGRRRGQAIVGNRLPCGLGSFIAAHPCLGLAVVHLGMQQLQRRSTAGCAGIPSARAEIMHHVDRIACGIIEAHRILLVGEAAGPIAYDGDGRVFRRQSQLVFRDHQITPAGN